MKKIGICGLGLGYCLSHYLASLDYDVVGVDIRPETFEKPNPKVDDEMREFIEANYHRYASNLHFTTNHGLLSDRDYILVFVATPLINNRLNMGYVISALESSVSANPDATYLILSTLPVNGMQALNNLFPDIRAYYTPPMVRQGRFLSTFRNPPSGWQLIGFSGDKGGEPSDVIEMYRMWVSSGTSIIPCDERVAEIAKLATNMMLSIKIVCANAIASWIGEDIATEVCKIVNRDPRVGIGYFTPGGPAAGPCFPRDLTELEIASVGTDLEKLLKVINELNGTGGLIDV